MKPDRTNLPDMVQQTLWQVRDIVADRGCNILTALSMTGATHNLYESCIDELWNSLPWLWGIVYFKSHVRDRAVDISAYAGRSNRHALKLIDRTLVARQVAADRMRRELAGEGPK